MLKVIIKLFQNKQSISGVIWSTSGRKENCEEEKEMCVKFDGCYSTKINESLSIYSASLSHSCLSFRDHLRLNPRPFLHYSPSLPRIVKGWKERSGRFWKPHLPQAVDRPWLCLLEEEVITNQLYGSIDKIIDGRYRDLGSDRRVT